MNLKWKGRNYRPASNYVKVSKPDINELIKPLSQKKGLGSAILTGSFISGIGDNYPVVTPTASGPLPSPSVTPTITITPSFTPTNTPTLTITPSATPLPAHAIWNTNNRKWENDNDLWNLP